MSKWCGFNVFKNFGLRSVRTVCRYQDYRIYIDEYENYEELRDCYFLKDKIKKYNWSPRNISERKHVYAFHRHFFRKFWRKRPILDYYR